MYDSMVKAGHKEANIRLKSSIEEILKEEQQQEWTLEQMQVPQQTDKESCGYRMWHNINQICNQENIEIIADKEIALEGYTLEIIKMLKGKQQNIISEKNGRGGKRARKEKEPEKETGKEKQELERKEQEMQEKISKKTRRNRKKEKRKRRRRRRE